MAFCKTKKHRYNCTLQNELQNSACKWTEIISEKEQSKSELNAFIYEKNNFERKLFETELKNESAELELKLYKVRLTEAR